jgi:hypothetical protein
MNMGLFREDIVVKGQIRKVDAIQINNLNIIKIGKRLKIAKLKMEWDDDVSDPKKIIEGLKHSDLKCDIFTFCQRLPDSYPQYQYKFEWDNAAALPLSTYENWYKNQLHPNPRNKIRRAKKAGIQIKRCEFNDELIEGILKISNESPVRQGKPYWYFGVTRDKIRKLWSTFLDRSVFLGAFLNDELIGYIKLVTTSRYIRTMGFIAMIQHRDKAPMNALMDKAVEYCTEQQAPFLVFSQYNYGKVGSNTLMDFKKYNGFESIMIPRYFIPLTAKGQISLKMNLQRGLTEILPRKVIRSLRSMRNMWYEKIK